MKSCRNVVLFATASFLALGSVAYGQEDQSDEDEIVVTAQKRDQAINDVPMSITALTGDQLAARGVESTEDLARVVPGFTFTQSPYSAPVYSIRGVGFYDYSIGATPTVSVYLDEAPLSFSVLSRGAGFDLSRVEVLKGPQGLFFGSNSTGGAVNYIAARPTANFEAGFDAGYGNFGAYEIGGFVSGPLGPNLSARLALSHEASDDWQTNTVTGEGNGARDFTRARLLVDWDVSSSVALSLNINGFTDTSDGRAGQFTGIAPVIPGFESPILATLPLANRDGEQAGWGSQAPSRDDQLLQGVFRADIDISDAVTFTSLTAAAAYEQDAFVDPDSTPARMTDTRDEGSIDTLAQEFRLAGASADERLQWVVGANYEQSEVNETQTLDTRDSSGFVFFGILPPGPPTPDIVQNFSDQSFESTAAFFNLDYNATDALTLHAGLRYTDTTIDFTGCTSDSANGRLGVFLNFLLGASFTYDQCTTLDATFTPGLVNVQLAEDNLSWRVGADYRLSEDVLLYANVSQGYKAGSFPVLPTASSAQNDPVTQEALLAYELGFKATLADRTLQFNGAVFYYDYTDKQILGTAIIFPFGPLNRLVNIPSSSVEGAEVQLDWSPTEAWQFNLGATYLNSEIGDFANFDSFGAPQNFQGESFPNTPDWQVNVGATYNWTIGELEAFAGGNVSYHSDTNGALGEDARLAIDAYTLLDLRVGVGAPGDSWRVTLWGQNVTDEYYWTNAFKLADVTGRFAGMPATYGVRLETRF